MRKVIVSASTEYAILIGRGLLKQAGAEIAKRIRPCKAAIITDTTVENAEATVLSTGVKRTSALLLATSTVAAISLLEATAYSRTV